MKARIAIAAATGVIALATTLIRPWEGRELIAYRDVVGVMTVCYGHTEGVRAGDKYTAAQCEAMLHSDIGRYWAGVSKCINRPVTDKQGAAILSWAFNVGVPAACGSTLIRQLNAGAPASLWCRQLLRWNRAGGREIRGLSNRRQAEYKVCIQ